MDTAARGDVAVDLAQGAPYDSIVLDVMLPWLDGFVVAVKGGDVAELDADRARQRHQLGAQEDGHRAGGLSPRGSC